MGNIGCCESETGAPQYTRNKRRIGIELQPPDRREHEREMLPGPKPQNLYRDPAYTKLTLDMDGINKDHELRNLTICMQDVPFTPESLSI